MKKKIAVITPGGDAPGMNACVRAVVRYSIARGYDVCGINRGYSGLLEEDITQLAKRSVSNIVQLGGTILKSARCKDIRTKKGIRKAGTILKKYGIGWLIIIGGDGSLTAGGRIARSAGIPVTGIPASIDNDIYGTDETVGFDTAMDTAVDAVDKIRDTATSFERVFIVEVMGREHGYLALNIGVAVGAEFVIIPEKKVNINDVCKRLISGRSQDKTSAIIIYAEGAGNAREFAKQLEKRTGMSVRVSSLGYIQRGGSPSGRSRILGALFGTYAVDMIKKNRKNRVVVLKNGKINSIPLGSIAGREKPIDKNMCRIVSELSI